MKELDVAVLVKEVLEHGLMSGDVGTIVHCYPDNAAYEVEFVAAEGSTIAVLTLESGDVRPMGEREILHARELANSEAA